MPSTGYSSLDGGEEPSCLNWRARTTLEKKLIVLVCTLFITTFILTATTVIVASREPICDQNSTTTVAPTTTPTTTPTSVPTPTPDEPTPSTKEPVTTTKSLLEELGESKTKNSHDDFWDDSTEYDYTYYDDSAEKNETLPIKNMNSTKTSADVMTTTEVVVEVKTEVDSDKDVTEVALSEEIVTLVEIAAKEEQVPLEEITNSDEIYGALNNFDLTVNISSDLSDSALISDPNYDDYEIEPEYQEYADEDNGDVLEKK